MIYPQIIGITGNKQNGKDTLGNYLIEKHGYIRVAFADAIKDMLKPTFGFTDEQLNGSLKEIIDPFWNVSPRKVLQYVGTELFRDNISNLLPQVESNFWVFIVKKKIFDILKINSQAKIVITDIRYQNELDLINEIIIYLKSGTTIRIERPFIKNDSVLNHSSEINIEKLNVQLTIINNSSIEHLQSCIDSIF